MTGDGGIPPGPLFRVRARHRSEHDPDSTEAGAPVFEAETTSWSVRAWGGPVAAGADPEGRVRLLLFGETCPPVTSDALVAGYVQAGDAFLRDQDGSWVVVVVDGRQDRVLVVTDRLGSRPAVHHLGPAGHIVSNRLAPVRELGPGLDPAGVAWFLSNGKMPLGRTPYEDVRVLRCAHAHVLEADGVRSDPYWEPAPSRPPEADPDRAEVEDALMRRIVDGVRDRVAGAGHVMVSVSGGWDSTTVAAAVADLGRLDAVCVSYAHGPPGPGTDAFVARQVARRLGLEHKVVSSYRGDYVGHVLTNARWGEGLAPVCDEIDAWLALEARAPEGLVLLTGDQNLEDSPIRDARMRDRPKIPGKLRSFHRLREVAHLLPRDTYRTMAAMVEADIGDARARAARRERGSLYMDERLPHALMPWRSQFPGRFAAVRHPLLAYPVLDFMAGVPLELRRDYLFQRAAERTYRAAFDAPRATRGGYAFDLAHETRRHADALRELLAGPASPLDDLVPVRTALGLIRHVETYGGLSSRVARRLRRSRFWPGRPEIPESAAAHGVLSPAAALRNLLILREAVRPG